MLAFNLKRIEIEENRHLDTSKLFGSPTFPEDFLSKHHLDTDYFFAQLNLDEIKDDSHLLPETGMLYFFLRFTKYSVRPVVVYSTEELYEVMGGPNEMFDELDFKDALYMDFCNDGKSGFIIGSIDQELPEHDDEDDVVLLKVDPLNVLASDFPIFNNPDDEIYFLIKKEDLDKKNFKKVKLVFHGS